MRRLCAPKTPDTKSDKPINNIKCKIGRNPSKRKCTAGKTSWIRRTRLETSWNSGQSICKLKTKKTRNLWQRNLLHKHSILHRQIFCRNTSHQETFRRHFLNQITLLHQTSTYPGYKLSIAWTQDIFSNLANARLRSYSHQSKERIHSWPPTLDHSNMMCRADHQAHGWPPTPDLSKMMRIADHQPPDLSNVVCRADRQPLTSARWCAGLTTNPWPQQDDVHGWAARWCTWLTTNPWPQQDDAHGWTTLISARWCAWLTTNPWPQQDDAHGWPPTPDLSKIMCMADHQPPTPDLSKIMCLSSKMVHMADHQPLTLSKMMRMADHQPLTSARWCAWLTTNPWPQQDDVQGWPRQPWPQQDDVHGWPPTPDLSKMMHGWPPTPDLSKMTRMADHQDDVHGWPATP